MSNLTMKKTYILILIIILTACSDKNKENYKNSLDNNSDEIHEIMNEKQSKKSEEFIVSETRDHQENTDEDKIICSNKNITEWYGFDEASAEPKCEKVKNFKLSSYKCEVSKNAFGGDKDAILLENNEQRIFSYLSLNDCNEMLEIRDSNAP